VDFSQQQYSTDLPAVTFGQAVVSRDYSTYNLSLLSQGSRYQGKTDWSTDLTTRFHPRTLGRTGVRYGLAFDVGYGTRFFGVSGGQANVPGTSVAAGAELRLYPPAWKFSRRTAITTDVGTHGVWYSLGATYSALDARVALRHAFGPAANLNVAYSHSLERGGFTESQRRRRVDLNFYATRSNLWTGYTFGSWDLENGTTYGAMSLSYRLPYQRGADGRRKWRLDLQSSYSEVEGVSQTDARIALGRTIGNYELLGVYSPTASGNFGSYNYGYGFSRNKRFWVELQAAPF
jgi:hypothetical protein